MHPSTRAVATGNTLEELTTMETVYGLLVHGNGTVSGEGGGIQVTGLVSGGGNTVAVALAEIPLNNRNNVGQDLTGYSAQIWG